MDIVVVVVIIAVATLARVCGVESRGGEVLEARVVLSPYTHALWGRSMTEGMGDGDWRKRIRRRSSCTEAG